jgi:5-methylcytosine-specific restriction endonuclease McrA
MKMLGARLRAEKLTRLVVPVGDPDSWRNGLSTSERGYDWRWKKARIRFLTRNPLCCYCQAKGIITAANVVDHKIPHRGDKALFWDESQWQPLCDSCHSSEKQREEKRTAGG